MSSFCYGHRQDLNPKPYNVLPFRSCCIPGVPSVQYHRKEDAANRRHCMFDNLHLILNYFPIFSSRFTSALH